MRPPLVFWRGVPHDVDLGYIDYLAENWGNKITVICQTRVRNESLNFGMADRDNITTYILDEEKDKDKIVSDAINCHKDAIHIFAGMRGEVQKYLDMYISSTDKPRVVINAEIPSFTGNIAEQLIRKVLLTNVYRKLCKKYDEYIDCFLPLGRKGCEIYSKFGFSKDKMFPFMYCPRIPEIVNVHNELDEVRFLYVGRMDVKDKGLDNLQKAVDMLTNQKKSGWKLDLVGGYGDDTQKVYKWANNYSNVNCFGTIAFDTICQDMKNYDVCLVPSHYDGWNMTPNMAICSGCATIVTDKATSDELVRESDTGIIIEDNAKQLCDAMKKVCEDKSLLKKYKANTLNYKNRILDNKVGQYFIDILDYSFKIKDIEKPRCPWL